MLELPRAPAAHIGSAPIVSAGGMTGANKLSSSSQGEELGKARSFDSYLVEAVAPGLGAKADEWFQKGSKGEIVGKTAGQLATTKDNGEIDAITASTITTRSFLRAVNNAYAEYAKVVNPHAEADVHTSATAKDMN